MLTPRIEHGTQQWKVHALPSELTRLPTNILTDSIFTNNHKSNPVIPSQGAVTFSWSVSAHRPPARYQTHWSIDSFRLMTNCNIIVFPHINTSQIWYSVHTGITHAPVNSMKMLSLSIHCSSLSTSTTNQCHQTKLNQISTGALSGPSFVIH